jgi:hypothetical protein
VAKTSPIRFFCENSRAAREKQSKVADEKGWSRAADDAFLDLEFRNSKSNKSLDRQQVCL